MSSKFSRSLCLVLVLGVLAVGCGKENLPCDTDPSALQSAEAELASAQQAVDSAKSELESAISSRLKPDYLKNPRVSVEVIDYRPIYVLGEVREPGSYPYSANLTVVNAIALAGGYTYRAAKRKIEVIKANDPEKKKRPISEQETLAPGDLVEVPERFF